MATGSNSHSHPVKVGGKTYTTGSIGHQHTETPKPADSFTAAEVTALKALLVAGGGGGGTAPLPPNDPPPPTPDIIAPTVSNLTLSSVTSSGVTVACNTDEAATVRFEYGLTSSSTTALTTATTSGTSHLKTITGLLAGSDHRIRALATDTAGNLRQDSWRTFRTIASPAPVGGVSNVSSWSALLTALANPTNREIILADGTYSISQTMIDGAVTPGFIRTASTSVVVRAATDGGVTLDLGGSGGMHLWIRNGIAYQEWRGFKFGNSHPGNNGVVGLGEGNGTPLHHVTLRNIELLSSITAGPGPNGNYINGQGIYFTWANGGGNHDLLLDGFISNAELWAPIHIYHDEGDGPGDNNIIRNATINCVGAHGQNGIVAWSGKLTNWLFEDIDINGANEFGFRHRNTGSSTMTLRRVVTTASGVQGFFSEAGSYPSVPGVTFDTCSFG
jgi:hypothetical protein